MAEIISDNIYLITLLPLWIFLIIMCGRFFSVYVNPNIIKFLTLFASLLGAVLSAAALLTLGADKIIENQFPFIKINDFIITAGIYADKTSLIFTLVLFLTAFFVQLFSISYTKNEKKNYRFFALLNLFNFAMTGLFFSPNMFQAYVFWELAGIVSYLLIGFDYFKEEKSIASKKVFIINKLGDTALIGGIIICSCLMYEYGGNHTLAALSFMDMTTISALVYAYTSTPVFLIICGLFITGAAVKSAQFPFYNWLQDAMEAKLPVSALLHSAALVASGIFILLRLMSFFTLESNVLKLIAVLGLFTALICSICACAQIHPKKALAYSTSAQLGLIFFTIGNLNIKAAVALFAAHAFIKSALFLTLPRENEKWNYINFILFLISGLSLSGIIFSAMPAKEMIYSGLSAHGGIAFCTISFLTAFYIIRITLVTADRHKPEKRIKYKTELAAAAGLVLLNIVLYLYLRKYEYKVSEPFWTALAACVCACILYVKNAFWKIPFIYPLAFKGFYLDNFYTGIIANIYGKLSNFANIIDTKILGNFKPLIFCAETTVKIAGYIEKNIMDRFIRLTAYSAKALSKLDLKAQGGNIQRYNAYAFVIITLILTCLIVVYTAIIEYIGG